MDVVACILLANKHSSIDRLSRQAQDPQTRQYALSGTNTMLNSPPSANTTLNDTINLGYAAGTPISMANVMSSVKGPFCYIYD
jgi:tyrosinase